MKKNLSIIFCCLVLNLFASGISAPDSLKVTIAENQKQVPPQILVIFGVSGDLTKRKLVPALLQLERKGLLPKQFMCVGVGRRAMNPAEFHQEVAAFLTNEEQELWESFKKRMVYVQGDIARDETYKQLLCTLNGLESHLDTKGNRLFYLATPASNFSSIVEQLHTHGLLAEQGTGPENWSRVVIEKPFGSDLLSAMALQQDLLLNLVESQIYLIDHYLGKEVVRNLLTFRFTNLIIESLWNCDHIDHVEITLSEDIGVGTRGGFWEQTGMLRDMVQNHAMQLLSLVGMEKPKSLDAIEIRKEKVNLIHSIRAFPQDQIDQYIMRGQYGRGVIDGVEVAGYRQEKDVPADSNVETFVKATLYIDNARWEGVPFYIKAGKRLSKKLTEIVITFKSEENGFWKTVVPNQLVFRIQPKEEIFFSVNSFIPGLTETMQPEKLSFPLHEKFAGAIPDGYKRLLYDAMRGVDALFVSYEEHLAAWLLFTPVLTYWKQTPPSTFPNYSAGSAGP